MRCQNQYDEEKRNYPSISSTFLQELMDLSLSLSIRISALNEKNRGKIERITHSNLEFPVASRSC